MTGWITLKLESLALLTAFAAFVVAGWRKRITSVANELDISVAEAAELRIELAGSAELFVTPLPATIGRSASADVVIADPHVSRLHARIDIAGGEIFLRDLESRNGTSVNARPIDGTVKLEPGDEIRIGRARIVFRGVGPWK